MDLASTFYAARLRSSAVILQDQAFEREAIMDWQPPARPRPFHAHEHKPEIGYIAIALPVLSAREMPTSTPSSSAMNCACASICKAVLVDGQVYAWIHQLLQPSRR
jgi:hypothetical protein